MTKYIGMVFVGACSFGILSTFVKLAYREGYTAAEISVSQAFIGMMVLWIGRLIYEKMKTGQLTFRLQWPTLWPLLLTGVAIGLTTFVYYVSVQYIPASVAIVLLMQFTWMGVVLDWLFFKKRPGWIEVASTVMILLGTLLSGGILRAQAAALSVTGIAYALGSALLYAIYIVANSRVGKQLPALQKSSVIMCGSCMGIFLVNAPALLTSTHFDSNLLKWALFLALFGTIIPPVLFAKGIPKIGAGISAIVMSAELPVAVICSHVILQEPVDGWQWTGVVIMLLSMGLLEIRKTC